MTNETPEYTDIMWSFHTISAYESILDRVDIAKWDDCPTCKQKPRVWVFNNGNSAKCLCSDLYGEPQARAESIMSVHTRTGGTKEYDAGALRSKWNAYCKSGVTQVGLITGRW